jgi:hypothetical protein
MVYVESYAKRAARKGLVLRKKIDFGLNPAQAKKLGIRSGVTTAKTLIQSSFISDRLARAIGRFYSRFRNCTTKRCEGALLLWGGRRFGREMAAKFKK